MKNEVLNDHTISDNKCSCDHEHKDHHTDGHHATCGCEHNHHIEHSDELDHLCSCSCCNDDDDDSTTTSDIIVLSICIAISIIAITFEHLKIFTPIIIKTIYVTIFLISGHKVLIRAVKNIIKGQILDENFLMSIASIAAFLIGEEKEALAVMIFYNLGEIIQGAAVKKSKKEISELLSLNVDKVNLLKNGIEVETDIDDVNIGDIIVVRAGDRIAIDAEVVFGNSSIDTSALTGESMPINVSVGDKILSGALNTTSVLHIKAEKLAKDSTTAKIIKITNEAAKNKAKSEKFITKFAKYYTPCVVIFAVLLFALPTMILGIDTYKVWAHRALTFLVASCPCALVISIPLTFFAAIAGASKFGILVKGADYFDVLSNTNNLKVIFDKTGTLTNGRFNIKSINFAENEEDMLDFVYAIESMSKHPIAIAICKEINSSKHIDVTEFTEIAGKGIAAVAEGQNILLGSMELLSENNISLPKNIENKTAVYLSVDNKYIGNIVLEDSIRAEAMDEIKAIRALNVKSIEMLTGDNENASDIVSKKLNLNAFKANLLPIDKLNYIKNSDTKTLFVGDGLNDAPVLVAADVGIAISSGLNAAIDAADVVLMNDNIKGISKLLSHAKRTMCIVKENIILVLAVKAIVLVLAAFGLAGMWIAIFADVGMALIAIVNATRILHLKRQIPA